MILNISILVISVTAILLPYVYMARITDMLPLTILVVCLSSAYGTTVHSNIGIKPSIGFISSISSVYSVFTLADMAFKNRTEY